MGRPLQLYLRKQPIVVKSRPLLTDCLRVSSRGHLWYDSYKNGCGLAEDCAYNLTSISHKASLVAAVIEREMSLLKGDAKKGKRSHAINNICDRTCASEIDCL